MPSIELYKRMLGQRGSHVGDVHKYNSDMAMEVTWNNDIQSRVAYLYDYFHDDQPRLNKGMTYSDDTTKTKIDIKFIITQYASLSKDQVEYHILFRPSQKLDFESTDELYYYETDFVQRYHATFPIGLYIDIPDDRGIYRKWLICSKEIGNQFIKFSVLPCDYEFMWIETKGNERIKRRMWGVTRQQNSYNSGLWTDYSFTTTENQAKLFLPMNNISERIFYTQEVNSSPRNMRMIVSALTERPITWKISKVENTSPLGLQRITLYQDLFDPNRDYVNLETGEMYADYYDTTTTPVDEESTPETGLRCELSTATPNIKAGGSYKMITAKFTNSDGDDVTAEWAPHITLSSWQCFVGDEELTDKAFITWKLPTYTNQVRLKFGNDLSYLTKILTVKCTVTKDSTTLVATVPLEIVAV